MRRLRALLLLLPAPAVPAGAAAAQERALVRGGVLAAESGERIPYAVVLLRPGFSQRFTDGEGGFVFLDVPPGRYALNVRQVGFLPFDTTITVTGGAPVAVRIELARVAVALAGLTVTGDATCRDPGPPRADDPPALHALFSQLRENAERYRLLVDSYPFRHRYVRQINVELADGGTMHQRPDTLEFRSDERHRYHPGRVVEWGRGRQSGTRIVHLPELPDLADSAFQGEHCFRYAGLDTLDGRALVRLEFQAAARLRDPDVDGTAWLDAGSYQLRRLAVRLTHAERAARGIEALSATLTFREVLPSLLVPEHVSGLTIWQPEGRYVGQVEVHRFLALVFLRREPGSGP